MNIIDFFKRRGPRPTRKAVEDFTAVLKSEGVLTDDERHAKIKQILESEETSPEALAALASLLGQTGER